MKIRILFILLILIGLLSSSSSFGRRCTARCRQKNKEIPVKEDFEEIVHDPDTSVGDCSIYGFGIIQKIPYARSQTGCGGMDVNFSSACIRCGMCVAIAHKINQTLLEVHEMMTNNQWLNNTEIVLLLRTICDYSFKSYQLQEIDGKRYISDQLPGATLLTTTADGLWGKNLRDMCHEYLNEIGELRLFEYWRRWYKDEDTYELTTVLCRSLGGILRDCDSMDNIDIYEAPYKPYYIKMKTAANRYT